MGYTTQAIKGVSWIGLLRGTTRIVSFGKIAILARILTPAQFGVYGIAALALSFLDVLTETGVNVILIQEKEDIDSHISSAWIVSILRGILMSVVILAIAPLVSSFFQSPDSLFLLQLISVVPLLRGFINPSVVKFQKELQFDREFWYRFVVFFVDASAAIIFAFAIKDSVSLVYGLIVGVLFEVVLSFFIVKPRPRFGIEKEYVKKIFHRGKWVTGSGVFNYLFHNGDNIVVGKLIGTTSLGLYQMAYSLSILPITEVSDVFSRVVFPVYTKISKDSVRLRNAFLKSTVVISLLTIPFGVLLFFFPQDIISIVLGDKWLGIANVLPILAVFGVLRAISGSASALFLAVGKQEYVTVVTFVSFIGLAVSIVPLVMQYGMVGAGMSALIGTVLAMPLFFYYTVKILYNAKNAS